MRWENEFLSNSWITAVNRNKCFFVPFTRFRGSFFYKVVTLSVLKGAGAGCSSRGVSEQRTKRGLTDSIKVCGRHTSSIFHKSSNKILEPAGNNKVRRLFTLFGSLKVRLFG